jgi:hypothetical protein
MLTDILRYCALNQGKHVLVRHPSAEPLRGSYEKVMQELLAGTPVEGMHIYKNHIHFGRPEMTDIIRTHRITERQIVNAGGIKELQLYVRQELARVGFDINRHIQVEQELASRSWLGVQTFPPDITFTDHACQQRVDTEAARRAITSALINYTQMTGDSRPLDQHISEWARENGIPWPQNSP